MTIEALLYIVICMIGAVAVYSACYAIAHLGGWSHLFKREDGLAACCSCGLILPISSWRLRGGLCAECEDYWGWPEERRWWRDFCRRYIVERIPEFPATFVDELEDAGPGILQYASLFILWIEKRPFIRERVDLTNRNLVELQVKLSGAWQYYKEAMIEDKDKLDWER